MTLDKAWALWAGTFGVAEESLREESSSRARRDAAAGRREGGPEDGKKLAGELEQLVDGESEQAEHQMRHDLAGSAHAQETSPEFIFQTAVDAFHHGALTEALLLGGRKGKPLAGNASGSFAPLVIAPQAVLLAFADR